MSRSQPARLLIGATSLLAVLACNLARPPQAQGPTGATSPVPASAGIPVSATPIRLTIPDGLATGATAETIDVVTDQTGAPWDAAPAHLQLTFQGYALQVSFHVPQLFVYPAQQYGSMSPAATESLKRLQAVLANPGISYDPDGLPRIPFFNAGQVIAAHQKVIRFTGGSGVRFITQYAQDVSPVHNSGLFYHFEGLSDDGKYYIVAILPVNLPFLPADNKPDSAVPSGGVPFPPGSASGTSYEDYFKEITNRIDAAPVGQFTPPLGLLDNLVQSILVDH